MKCIKSYENVLIWWKRLFLSNKWKGQILPKNVWFLKMSHIETKLFWCFEAILPEIDKKNSLFSVSKVFISESCTNYSVIFFFSMWSKRDKSWVEYFDLMETTFLVKQVKWGKYYWKQFWSSCSQNSTELSFSGVLKHFRLKLTKKNLFKV